MPTADKVLVIRAAAWLVVVRIALWALPFARVRALMDRAGARRSSASALAPGRVAWAVETSARSIPKATCLTQALAAKMLLERGGEHPELKLGVAKDAATFEAHAWLELYGRPILGDVELGRYAPLERR